MRHLTPLIALAAMLGFSTGAALALDIDVEGNIELELRHHPHEGRHEDMEQDFASIAGEFELGLFRRADAMRLSSNPLAAMTNTTMSAAMSICARANIAM